MKLTKKILNEFGLHNGHNVCVAGGGKIYIWYRARGVYRSGITPGWMVSGINFKTDPVGHWLNNGNKKFSGFPKPRAEWLEDAKKWAGEKYGITEWERDPFGDWQDKRVMDAIRNKISERKAGAK